MLACVMSSKGAGRDRAGDRVLPTVLLVGVTSVAKC